jgi:hypothetical protein
MKLVNLSIKILVGIILFTFIISLSSENKSTITSTSESNLSHGIFLNDKLFKYKNLKKNQGKIKSTAKLSSLSRNKNPTQTATPNPTSNQPSAPSSKLGNQSTTKNTDSGLILHKGWIKYFKYYGKNGVSTKYPNSFKENKQFFEQSKYFPNADLKAKKDGIYEYISDPNYFFLDLFENSVTINSSLQVRNL